MSPYFIKKFRFEDGFIFVTIGDCNDKNFEQEFKVTAQKLYEDSVYSAAKKTNHKCVS